MDCEDCCLLDCLQLGRLNHLLLPDKMNSEELVDYAMPMMKIEKLMRQTHDLCLKGNYAEAGDLCLSIATEACVLNASLAIMEDKKIALDKTYPQG
jgi:hypothetical protein